MATKYIDQAEAAKLLGVGVRRVQQLRAAGSLVSEKDGRGAVRLLRSAVVEYKRKRDTFKPAGQ